MKNFIGVFVVAMVLGLSACGTPTTSQPNPEPMPPATNVPSGEAPVGGVPDAVIEQPSVTSPANEMSPGGFPVGGGAPAVNNPPVNKVPGGVPPVNEAPVACTMDAKICPDGSAVGRTAPDCEFASCPGEER